MNAVNISDAMERIDAELIIPVEEKRIKQRKNAEKRHICAAACLCAAAGAIILLRLTGSPAAPVTSVPETGISETTPPDTDEPDIIAVPADGIGIAEKQTFVDVIYNSYAIVFARCTGTVSDKDGRTGYCFDTVAHLAGGEMPEEFAVYVPGTEYVPQMEENRCCILPVCKSISVFFDEYERYYLTSGTLFETDDDGNITSLKIQGKDVDAGIGNVGELRVFLESMGSICNQSSDDIGTKYSTADDPKGIFRDSDYVLEVEAIGINTDFFEDRTSYDCRVICEYKAVDEIDEIIDVTAPKSAMETGQKYIIAINRVSEGSDLFIVSSRSRSVYPAGSSEAEELAGF